MARAIVVGGGLSGLQAALDFRSAGIDVTLVEARRRVGGRVFSFVDPDDGTVLDNGQHVILGCCSAVRTLLDTLDLKDAVLLPKSLRVPIFKDGAWSTLGSVTEAGPLHLATGMLKYQHLPLRGRLTALKAAARFVRDRPAAGETFFGWLQRQGHPAGEIDALWNLLTISVFNADARELAADAAIRGFRFGFTGGPANAALGLFRRPLGELPEAMRARLEAEGGRVLLGAPVEGFQLSGQRVSGVRLSTGEDLHADYVVSALPPGRLSRLVASLPGSEEFRSRLTAFSVNPIVNVYLRFHRPVMDETAVAAVSSPVQFVFNRGGLMGGEGDLLALSVSAARELKTLSKAQILDRLLPELARIVPATKAATLTHARIVWQPDATVVLTPDTAPFRARPKTPWPGFTLAGDWTATDWPCSMESALRSGSAAVLAQLA